MAEITYNENDPNGPIRRAKINNNEALTVGITSESGGSVDTSPFNELVVVNKTTVLELKSIYGISDIRDSIVLSGTNGLVSNTIGDREYTVQVYGTNGSAKLSTVERGRYIAGKSAEYGIGIRLSSSTFSGDTVAKWGALNNSDGMYFGQDSNGVFVCVLDEDIETKVYQENWNVDKVDGTGESKLTLDTSKGQVYNQQFTWYGYGVIDFIIYFKTNVGLKKVIVHRYIIDGKTSINNPNLPVTAFISQTNTSTTNSIYVGGRQFSVLGDYTPSYRSSSELLLNKSVGTGSLIPLISFRQKEAYHKINAKVDGFDILTDQDLLVEIYIGATLTGESFGDLTRKIANETAFESDTSANSYSGGDLLFRTVIPGGGGNPKSVGVKELEGLILDIPEDLLVTMVAQSLTLIAATVDVVFRLREEW